MKIRYLCAILALIIAGLYLVVVEMIEIHQSQAEVALPTCQPRKI